MKQKLLNSIRLRAMMLVAVMCAAFAGQAWATDPTWSHEFASPEAISTNTITVDGATWSVATTVRKGSPTIDKGNSYGKYCLKFGSGKNNCYSSITFSTDYFKNYNVKSVTVQVLHNSSQSGTLSATQGSTSIGSTTATVGTSWTDMTVNTTSGSGGTLSFTYSPTDCAVNIHSITVTYTTSGGGGSDPSISLGTTSINVTKDAVDDGSISVTYNNLTDYEADVIFYEADGETQTDYDWITASINGEFNVEYLIDANTGSARTAYMKVYALDDEGEAFSDLITITQAAGLDAPSFSLAAGAVTAGTKITLTQATADEIRYTIDGTDPTKTTGTVYSGPIEITTATTIKAIAVKGDGVSAVASASYTISVAAPEYNLASSGNYLAGTDLTLTSDGNTIYYNMTTNGSDPEAPTSTSTEYAGPILLSSGTVKIKAIAYDSYGNASSVVSRTINGVNPTTLPFNWAGGGKATLTALTGVVGYGLGSDYGDSHNPYMVKFDNDDDYIEVFTDAQPMKVSIGVKMIGGNSTSKIKVQESTNGVEFTDVEELTISGSTNDVVNLETTEDFAATTRVIKLLFVKGANVGVGPIRITKYTVGPDIDVADSDVELAGDATYGEIEYSIINPDGVSSLSAESEDDWISEITVIASKVTFTTTANDGAERVGHITLSYPNAESKVVTVTQAEKVVTLTYNPTTTITSGKHYIITDGSTTAMGGQNTNNRGAITVTKDGDDVTFLSTAGVAEFVIYGPDVDGLYTIYDGTGYLYAASSSANNLKTQDGIDDNARWQITFDGGKVKSIVAQGSNSRNVMQYNSSNTLFSCYGSASQSDVYLYEKDGEATPTESVTVGPAGYTTYTTMNPVSSFPDGVTAYIATAVNPSTIHLEEVPNAPARTPLVIKAAADNYTLYSGTSTADVSSNILKSSDGSVAGNGTTIFALGVGKTGVNKGVVGFYLVNNGQTIPAGRAYLNTGASVKEFLTFDFDDATAIAKIQDSSSKIQDSEIFNLAGQKMSKLQKGVNIVNGKKVLVN